MAQAIGYLTRNATGGFEGTLALMSLKTRIKIAPNEAKSGDRQPDFRVTVSDNIEIGAGWNREGKASGKQYISLTLAAPEFGPRRLYANIAPAAGKLENEFVLLWNPQS